ncbi:hypothetical protein HWV62_41146 [Athelia sp. TMB]|nr:hypothetical protein HWV62_41146 [Athelia sp. TMB]
MQVGLLKKGNDWQIPNALWLYKSKKPDGEKVAKRFKETFCIPGVRVHFVGVWDTVSSVGIVGNKVLPHIDETGHIDIFRHALALDERRVKFIPECIMGRKALKDSSPEEERDILFEGKLVERVKEVWFPGSHSNVGGGGGLDHLQAIPLAWMMKEAVEAGLLLKEPKAWEESDEPSQPKTSFSIHDLQQSKPRNSLSFVWWPVEFFPVHRQSRANPKNTSHWRLHNGKGRAIYEDQKIHASVVFMGRDYRPRAVFRPKQHDIQWERLIAPRARGVFGGVDRWDALLEMDLFELDKGPSGITLFHGGHADHIVRVLDSLWTLASLDEVARKLLESTDRRLIDMLQPSKERKGEVFLSTVRLLARLSVFSDNSSRPRPSTFRNSSTSATTRHSIISDTTRVASTSDIARNSITSDTFANLSTSDAARIPRTGDTKFVDEPANQESLSNTPPSWATIALTNPEVIHDVLELLKDTQPGSGIPSLAASAITELAPIPQLRREFSRLGIVEMLVEMLKTSKGVTRTAHLNAYAVTNTLIALAAYDGFKRDIFARVCVSKNLNKATAGASNALPAITEASPDHSTKLRPDTLPAISNAVRDSPTKPHPKSIGIFPSHQADDPKQASQPSGAGFDVSSVTQPQPAPRDFKQSRPRSIGLFPKRRQTDELKEASQAPGVSFDVGDVTHPTSQSPKQPRPKSLGLFRRPPTGELSEAVQPFGLSFEILPGAQFPRPIALLAAEIAHYLINASPQDLPYGISADKAKEIVVINETTINLLVKMLDDPDRSYSAADALAKLAEQGTLFYSREYLNTNFAL